MEKNIDIAYKKYTADSVIKHGYSIYDEWKENKVSSRKIVSRVESVVSAIKQNKTKAASLNALATLFALDLRILEKYNNIIRCIFSYFSWRRETRAFKLLKSSLLIPESVEDIRSAIEVKLQLLRQKIETDEAEEGDDETHGGRRNGKAAEDVATQEKEQERSPEEKNEEVVDEAESKDPSEKEANDAQEQTPSEEPIKTEGELKQVEENFVEEREISVVDQKTEVQKETHNKYKVENNVPDNISEPSTDRNKETITYNEAVDSPPLPWEASRDKSAEKRSFIDEVIMDNMVKGKEDFIHHDPLDDIVQNKEVEHPQDMVTRQGEENDRGDKDAYLYDELIANNKEEMHDLQKSESVQKSEKVSEIKTEQTKESIGQNEKVETLKQEFKPLREMIQVDLTERQENDLREEICRNMSVEAILAIKAAQENAIREHVNITEFDMDAPGERIERPEPVQIQQPPTVANRK